MNAANLSINQTGQQGSADGPVEPRFLIIGKIVKPHGIRGEVSAVIITELPERFEWLETVFLSRDSEDVAPRPVAVRAVRFHKGQVLLRLAGYDTRNEAETLRATWLMAPEAEGIPLAEGEHYHFQLEGLSVYTEEGEFLGTVAEIIRTKANDVFLVRDGEEELLLPDIDEVIKGIDVDSGRMTVHLLPGLRP